MGINASRFLWDDFNREHIAKHNITIAEIVEACGNEIANIEGKKGRVLLFGWTKAKRLLSIILAVKINGYFYPVTARDTSQSERKTLKEKGAYAKLQD